MTAERIECAVSVIRRNGKVLIAQRKRDDRFGGYWEFPGGKKEPEETLEQCAVREAEEEVGLKIRIERFLMTVQNPYKDSRINLHFFLCSTGEQEPVPRECEDCRWVEPQELIQYAFPPANDQVISELLKTASGRSGI